MGTSATGILAYGFDLGDSPAFTGLDEYDTPDWWDEDNDAFADAAIRRLLDASGFTERYDDGRDGYLTREDEARKTLGVDIVRNASDGSPSWLLAAHTIREDWGDTTVIDPAALVRGPVENRWDERLAWAVEALGIKPADPPAWLLSADYG